MVGNSIGFYIQLNRYKYMIDKKVLDLKERRFYIRLIVTILILYMVGTLFYKSISPFHNCIRDDRANVIECTRDSTW